MIPDINHFPAPMLAHFIAFECHVQHEEDGYWQLFHTGNYSKPCIVVRPGYHAPLNHYCSWFKYQDGNTVELYERMEYVEGDCPLAAVRDQEEGAVLWDG